MFFLEYLKSLGQKGLKWVLYFFSSFLQNWGQFLPKHGNKMMGLTVPCMQKLRGKGLVYNERRM